METQKNYTKRPFLGGGNRVFSSRSKDKEKKQKKTKKTKNKKKQKKQKQIK